jgi:hypothetical protein
MIRIPRGLARSFRAALRKCRVTRLRSPAPDVEVRADAGGLVLTCSLEGVTLILKEPTPVEGAACIRVPMAVLEAVDGAAVELSMTGMQGTARWESRDGPQSHSLEDSPEEESPLRSALPDEMHAVSAGFLTALHECGRTAARESSRYALHRVQVQGKSGRVVATSGKHALICRGFRLTFRDTILIPAIPLFGSKELAGADAVHIGLTSDHFVVAAGPWTVFLPLDKKGSFPDVAGIVPRAPGSTVVDIEALDAAEAREALAAWPDTSEGVAAVTLEVEDGIVLRAANDETHERRELRLLRSTGTGPPVRFVLDRMVLIQALTLGCCSFRLALDKPMLAEGNDRTLLAVMLDSALAVPSAPSSDRTEVDSQSETPFQRSPMKPETNGSTNGRHSPETPNGIEGLDPLAEAESLRVALGEVVARVGRLIQCLRQFRRQKRVLETAFSSLKTLGMGPGGES